MLHEITLKMDTLDFQAIQEALARRQSWRVLPDSEEDGATLAGRIIAEICRGWCELHDSMPRDYDTDGDEWKQH